MIVVEILFKSGKRGISSVGNIQHYIPVRPGFVEYIRKISISVRLK